MKLVGEVVLGISFALLCSHSPTTKQKGVTAIVL